MDDTAGHGTPQPDHVGARHTLTVREVEALFAQAAVQRSHRHVLRLCKSGMLDAVKIAGGPSGDEWLVASDSVPKAIGDLKQIDEQRARRSATQLDTFHHVAQETSINDDTDRARDGAAGRGMSQLKTKGETVTPASDTPGPSATQPGVSQDVGAGDAPTSRYVALLERDNEFLRQQVEKKDHQLEDLSKRFGDTQSLLGAMQKMLAPLLGQADPYRSHQTPEDKQEVITP